MPRSAARARPPRRSSTLGWLDDQPLLGLAELFGLMRKAEIAGRVSSHRAIACGAARRADGSARGHVGRAPHLRSRGARPRARSCIACACSGCASACVSCSSATSIRTGRSSCSRTSASSTTRRSSCRRPRAHSSAASTSTTSMRSIAAVSGFIGTSRARRFSTVPPPIRDNAWLESRRAKLLFRVGQRYEKEGDLDAALKVYSDCAYPGARVRACACSNGRIAGRRRGAGRAGRRSAGRRGRAPATRANSSQVATAAGCGGSRASSAFRMAHVRAERSRHGRRPAGGAGDARSSSPSRMRPFTTSRTR